MDQKESFFPSNFIEFFHLSMSLTKEKHSRFQNESYNETGKMMKSNDTISDVSFSFLL